MLGHTTEDADDGIGVALLKAAPMLESVPDLLFGILTDGAGIHESQIGPFQLRRRLIAGLIQDGKHDFRVRHIHLAAVGLDIYLLFLHEKPITTRSGKAFEAHVYLSKL